MNDPTPSLPPVLAERLSDLLAAAIVKDVRARLAREHGLEDASTEAIANAQAHVAGR